MGQELKPQLIEISIKFLEDSVNSDGIFYNRIIQTEWGNEKKGYSLRYSIMALIGLFTAQKSGYEISLDLDKLKSNIFKRIKELPLMDLGNLLQLAAVTNDLDGFKSVMDFLQQNFSEADMLNQMTVGTAWLLTGLCLGEKKFPGATKNEKVIEQLKNRLLDSWLSNACLFCSGSGRMKNFIAAKTYQSIGCFADQVYPIIALSEFYQNKADSMVKTILQKTTEKLIHLQGNFGEWFWIYDMKRGNVMEKYPVYSVHQDSMAPMAFFAAEETLGKSFDHVVEKGLNWFGKMTFDGSEIIDEKQNIIWRSIKRMGNNKSVFNSFGLNYGGLNLSTKGKIFANIFLNRNIQNSHIDNLVIDQETRPYHYGWILNAFCKDRNNIE